MFFIKLKPAGKKEQRVYHIVLTTSKYVKSGKVYEKLGIYIPNFYRFVDIPVQRKNMEESLDSAKDAKTKNQVVESDKGMLKHASVGVVLLKKQRLRSILARKGCRVDRRVMSFLKCHNYK